MNLRAIATSVMALGLLIGMVTACASGQPDAASACDAAIAQATATDPASDTVQVADGGIAGCPSLEAWALQRSVTRTRLAARTQLRSLATDATRRPSSLPLPSAPKSWATEARRLVSPSR